MYYVTGVLDRYERVSIRPAKPPPLACKATHLRVRPNLKPVLTQMTLAAKVPNRRRVVVANLALLGVVAHPLANVVVAGAAVEESDMQGKSGYLLGTSRDVALTTRC